MAPQCGTHNTCYHVARLNLCNCKRVIPIKCFPYKSNYFLGTGTDLEYGDVASPKEQHLDQRSTWALQQVRGHHALHPTIYFNYNKQIDLFNILLLPIFIKSPYKQELHWRFWNCSCVQAHKLSSPMYF